jgi:tetratricopeptide (TPR) repeat protein
LKPFESKQTASAGEKRIAILYFENMEEPADPQRLGEIATNLLITDLSESEYVAVVSSQRVYDILKQMGKEGVKVVDRSTATEVARTAGASEMLVGTVLRVRPNVELTSQLIDVASGEARATQRVRGAEGEDVFALIDRLSTEVKDDLGLPRKASAEPEIAIADVTTHSAVAYRYYLEGIEEMNRYQFPQARACLERAIQIDSTFAMAWVALADQWMVNVAGLSSEQQKSAMAKAVAHSDKVSEREKRYIAALAKKFAGDRDGAIVDLEALVVDFPDEKRAYYELAQLLPAYRSQDAITALYKVIELDPMDKMAYNQLAYRYQSVDDREKSIWAINQYLHLAPGDANAYDSRGELYGFNGQIEQAIASYEKAVEIEPTFLLSWFKLGQLHLHRGREDRARDCWGHLLRADVPGVRAWTRLQLALIPLCHGRSRETIVEMEKAIAADRRDGYDEEALAHKHWTIGFLHVLRGEKQSADAAFRSAGRATNVSELLPRVALLAPLDVSRVEDDLRALEELGDEEDASWVAKCWVQMSRDQFAAAAESVGQAPGETPFPTTYTKGIAYLRSGRVAEAAQLLERARDMQTFSNAFFPTWTVQVHYHLALAYEALGRSTEAVEEYEEFLRSWGEGDIFRDQIDDARRRVANLRS